MSEAKKRKTAEELLKAKEEKLKAMKAELAALRKAQTKAQRRVRDTAIYTAGACMLAALEDDKTDMRAEVIELWYMLAARYPLELSDYRRACLAQTALKLPLR